MRLIALHNTKLLKWFNFFQDFRLYSPVAILFFVEITDSFALGLMVFSVVSLSSAIAEVPTGVISDFIGRKKTIIVGALFSTLSLFVYALSGSFLMLAIGSIFGGIGRSFFSGNNDALLYDSLLEEGQEKKYGDLVGKVSSMFQVGLGISALIGGFIADISLAYVMWASIIPQVITIFIGLFIIEPKNHNEKMSGNVFVHIREALIPFKENAKLRTLSLTSILNYGIGETLHQFIPAFFALLWPTWAIGIARSIAHGTAWAGFWFAGAIIKKFGALKSLLVSNIINRGISLLAIAFPTILSPLLMSLTSLSFGLETTARNMLMNKEFTNKQRATMGSLNALFGSIFFAVFAASFGLIVDVIGERNGLLIGEILLISTILLYWSLFRRHVSKT